MGAETKTHFVVDKAKCIKCGRCINTCSGMVIEFGEDGYPYMKEFERFGWGGCWRCQHAVFAYKVGENHQVAAGHMKSIMVSYTAEIELRPVAYGEIKRKYDSETGTGFWSFT